MGVNSRTISSASTGPRLRRSQLAFRANHRRAADSHVQIASFQLHDRPEDLVDFQLLLLQRETRSKKVLKSSSLLFAAAEALASSGLLRIIVP